jgi:hypothetical protein
MGLIYFEGGSLLNAFNENNFLMHFLSKIQQTDSNSAKFWGNGLATSNQTIRTLLISLSLVEKVIWA